HSMATKGLPEAVGSVLATPIGEDIVEPKLEPIVVSSRDEVRDVARSINDVQQRALQLAVEQAMQRRNFADSFLNLGRRVQGLVARQLDFITDLERTEEDEQVLENLFKLDHLATRIRRNAESLIVLAGVTRQRRAGQPAPVIDALRSALSEVDEYTRVTIGNVDEARLPTSVAADLAHILAELIENGLNFSPPTTTVDVSGRRLTDGYEITIVDHGIGMTPEQVETANRRLSGQESFTVAPSRYMGHFVAGHLATGLGISVELRSDADGTTATVTIGERLLARSRSARTASAPAAAAESSPSTVAAPAVASPTTAAASPQGSDLESLLGVHRRLSNPEPADTPDKSPWAQSADTEASGDDQS
ncbi:MAG: sensor histidine kinase, partial [Actinobacteria bacterium]|nr:sensor histidine kinase [Actinomycetota bacterium]